MTKREHLEGILAIITYIALYIFSAFIPVLFPIQQLSTEARYIISSLYEVFITIIIILIFIKNVKHDFPIYIKNIGLYLKYNIKYWLYALGSMYICNLILYFISGNMAKNEQGVRELFQYYPVITFILAAFLAPLLEELIFRVSLYKILGNHKWVFIILSGLIFGSMHIIGNVSNIIDVLYIIPYSLPGCFFAYALYQSKNIFTSINLHMIHNLFALIIMIIATL